MKEDLKVDVEQIIKDTVSEAILELKKQGFIKNNKQTAFQKTEQLLYNYMNFKQVIIDKQKHIDFIKENGIQKRSKSIVNFTGNYQLDTKLCQQKSPTAVLPFFGPVKLLRKIFSHFAPPQKNIFTLQPPPWLYIGVYNPLFSTPKIIHQKICISIH